MIEDQNPSPLEQEISRLSKMLGNSFNDAENNPDAFLLNAQKSTEAICTFLYSKDLGKTDKKLTLNDLARELVKHKIIPDRIGVLIGTIQTYGDYAQEDLNKSTKELISPCQTALASLTNWFFLEYLKRNIPNELTTPVSVSSDYNTTSNQENEQPDITGKTSKLFTLIGIIILAFLLSLIYFLSPDKDKSSKTQNNFKTTTSIKEINAE